jgi:hypothetical protein
MCGQLNDQVVSHALRALKKLAPRRDHQVTIAAGIRAASQLEAEGKPVEQTVDVHASIGVRTAARNEPAAAHWRSFFSGNCSPPSGRESRAVFMPPSRAVQKLWPAVKAF